MDISRFLDTVGTASCQAGEPGVGYTVAYEEGGSPTGWDLGVVKRVDRTMERLNFLVASPAGWLVVNRGRVLRWWSAS